MRTVLSLALVACAGCPPVHPHPDAAGPSRSDVMQIQAVQNPDLDLLFVIDDSPSMLDKQQAFNQVFPAFLGELATVPNGLPNLHLGVASTDMGTKGSASPTPALQIGNGPGMCKDAGKAGVLQTNGSALITSGNFLISGRDGTKNYTGALADALTAMSGLGEQGCGFEQPLAAMRTALDDNPSNPGFLRDGANLGVIVLSDEDDCSVKDPGFFSTDPTVLGPLESFRCFKQGVQCSPDDPTGVGDKTGCAPRSASAYLDDVAPFASFLLGKKHGDARKLTFGAVIGDPAKVAVELRPPPGGGTAIAELAHACTFTVGANMAVADPAVRTAALAGTLGAHGAVASICSGDLSPALAAMGKAIKRMVGDPCLPQPLRDGASTDCIVDDVRDSAPDVHTILRRCGEATPDCFDLVEDLDACHDAQHLKLVVHRADPPAADLWSTLRCAL